MILKKVFYPLILIPCFVLLKCGNSSPARPVVEISTQYGNIELVIYTDKAPVTANNFLEYIERGLYKHACFYRVVTPENQPDKKVKIEVIQGGLGFADSLPGLAPIEHESTLKTGLKHKNGVLSMARLEPGTASSEFFICVGDQPELDFGGKRNPDGQGFAAFGRVTRGMDTVKKIQSLSSTSQMLDEPVSILDIRIIQ